MKWTTAEKVNAGFGVALAIVAIIGIASTTSIQRFANTTREVSRTHLVLRHIQTVLLELTDAESASRGYVITGDEAYLEPYEATAVSVHREIHRIREETFEDTAQQRRVSVLGDLAARRIAIMSENIELRRSGAVEEAEARVRSGRGLEVMDSIREIVNVIDRAELERLSTSSTNAGRRGRAATAIIAAGGVFAFLIVLGSSLVIRRDYTERRRAELALRNSETLLSQFMENLPIGVVVVDDRSRVRFANNAAFDLIGPSIMVESGERPLPLYRMNEPRPYPETETPLSRALAGTPTSASDAMIQVDGRSFPVEVSAAPIYDARGRITYAIAAFSDTSERHRAEEALRTAKDAAEAASRTKSDFLARMSHELRTPLNSVIGFANILLKNRAGRLAAQDLAYLDRILENGKHLLLLINDILDLSKIEAGKVELELAPTDVGTVVRSVVTQLEAQAKQPVQLRTRIPDQLQSVSTDAVRLRQVLLNLVGNALKFTEQGHVEVRVETGADGHTPARVEVADTGIGIPADRLEAIFDAFEQAESSTTRKYGGTGLGLPISRALCELLGYQLRATSTAGEGTVFTIDLQPHRRADLAEAAALARSIGSAPRGRADRLVLIIDDQADSRILLTEFVEEFGCRALATHAGSSALALARELQPDLITVDLRMPGMNGWDLIAALKDDPAVSHIPVIVVSIVAQESRASLLGARDVVQKPIEREALFRVLRRYLGSGLPRILVVDGDGDMRRVLTEQLTSASAELRMAEHGDEALTVLREFAPDVIITDLSLPVMDGLTLIETLRANSRFQHVPIIVLTAQDPGPADLEWLQRNGSVVLRRTHTLATDLRRMLHTILGASNAA